MQNSSNVDAQMESTFKAIGVHITEVWHMQHTGTGGASAEEPMLEQQHRGHNSPWQPYCKEARE